MGYNTNTSFSKTRLEPPMFRSRRIVYIRSVDPRPLYLRLFGGRFHLVVRILYPDKREHHGFYVATGDFVEIKAINRTIRLEISENSVLTEESKFAALGSQLYA